MIALDTSVLIDVLVADPRHADASEAAIASALAAGEVVVCEAVVAELQSMLDTDANVMEVLESMGVRFQPGSEQVAIRAGLMYRRFRARGGRRERVIPDFLIGFGFTDDVAVLTAAIAAVRNHITPAHRAAARKALEDAGA